MHCRTACRKPSIGTCASAFPAHDKSSGVSPAQVRCHENRSPKRCMRTLCQPLLQHLRTRALCRQSLRCRRTSSSQSYHPGVPTLPTTAAAAEKALSEKPSDLVDMVSQKRTIRRKTQLEADLPGRPSTELTVYNENRGQTYPATRTQLVPTAPQSPKHF